MKIDQGNNENDIHLFLTVKAHTIEVVSFSLCYGVVMTLYHIPSTRKNPRAIVVLSLWLINRYSHVNGHMVWDSAVQYLTYATFKRRHMSICSKNVVSK